MSGMASDETLPGPVAAPEAPFAPGTFAGAGRYRVIRFIASGAMGEVYEVDDLTIGDRIALKVLRQDLAVASQAIERLRREVAIARRVTHSNICRLHDVGDHEGRVFITMELLPGETLAARIRGKPLPLDELERIARQLVAGLAALHAAKVVHRDFKSANILLAGDRAVITDFGLARAIADDRSLTADGALLGTPSYMAPEQVEGRDATPASDIYALGVVLYEMATGELPFRGDTAIATATARLQQSAPRASSRRADIPPALDATIARCLERDPAARFARVEDVLDAPPATRRRGMWVIAAVAIAIVVAMIVIVSRRDTTPATPIAVAPDAGTPVLAPREKILDHLRRGEAALARALLEPMLAESPEDPWIHYQLALALDELGEDAAAAKHVQLAYDRRSSLNKTDQLRVEVDHLVFIKDLAGALAASERLVLLDPTDVDDGLTRAFLLRTSGRTADGLAIIAGLRTAHPSDPRIDLAESSLVVGTDQARARTLAAKALVDATAQRAPLIEAAALNRMAWTDAALGNLTLAEDEAEGARRRFAAAGHRSSVINTLNTLALVRWLRGRYREAIAAHDTAIDVLGATHAPAYVANRAIGRALAGELEVADTTLKALPETMGDAPLLFVFRGWVAELRGDLPRSRIALDHARTLVRHSFDSVLMHWRSGVTYGRAGDLKLARRDLERAIADSGPAGMRSIGSQARIDLARVALAEGNHTSALALARQGFGEQRERGSTAGVGFALAIIAEAQLAGGDAAGARATLAEAAKIRDQIQNPAERGALDAIAKRL